MTSRSGRVTLDVGEEKTVIAEGLSGSTHAVYRFFNSGKEGDAVTIRESGGSLSVTLDLRDSVDVPVGKKEILVKAGAKTAEVVYELLGYVT